MKSKVSNNEDAISPHYRGSVSEIQCHLKEVQPKRQHGAYVLLEKILSHWINIFLKLHFNNVNEHTSYGTQCNWNKEDTTSLQCYWVQMILALHGCSNYY